MGWSKYIMTTTGDAPIPKAKAPSPSDQKQVAAAAGRVTKIWSGVKTLSDWIDSGAPAVPQSRADARAKVCATCPKNEKGKALTDIFTVPVANMIKKKMERLNEMNLKTRYDDILATCQACLCPMRTKVWVPTELVLKRLKPDQKAELQPDKPQCWILQESQLLTQSSAKEQSPTTTVPASSEAGS